MIGKRIWHHNGVDSYGFGTIRDISDSGKTYDVEWEKHRVIRKNSKQDETRSHVDVGNCYPVSLFERPFRTPVKENIARFLK